MAEIPEQGAKRSESLDSLPFYMPYAILQFADPVGMAAVFQEHGDLVQRAIAGDDLSAVVSLAGMDVRPLRACGQIDLALHRALGLSVYSRSDFILDDEGKAWCLEINTLPGMTPTSLVPQEAAQVGLSYADLCEKIIHDSLEARKAAKL